MPLSKAQEAALRQAEEEEARMKAKRRMLGNIRFIGELYKKKMLKVRPSTDRSMLLVDADDGTPQHGGRPERQRIYTYSCAHVPQPFPI